jgi:hypothetical protein
MITRELFYGNFTQSAFAPISPIDGYEYRHEELTGFSLTLDETKGGVDFFTLAERQSR